MCSEVQNPEVGEVMVPEQRMLLRPPLRQLAWYLKYAQRREIKDSVEIIPRETIEGAGCVQLKEVSEGVLVSELP